VTLQHPWQGSAGDALLRAWERVSDEVLVRLECAASGENVAHIRQSRPDSSPGSRVKGRERERRAREAKEREREGDKRLLALGTPRPPPYTGLHSCG